MESKAFDLRDLLDGRDWPRAVCPETKQSLTLAADDVLAELNGRIERGELRHRGGDIVEGRLTAGFIREDGKVLYPFIDEIPYLIIESGIELG